LHEQDIQAFKENSNIKKVVAIASEAKAIAN